MDSIILCDGIYKLSERAKGKHSVDGLNQGLFFMALTMIEKPRTVVEIGCQEGFSTSWFAMGIRNNQTIGMVYGIDINPNHVKTAEENLKKFELDKFAKVFAGNGVDVIKKMPEMQSIDILFIDGDHSLEAVYRDMINAVPFVKANGIIICHDYGVPDVRTGIQNALKEFEDAGHIFVSMKINILTTGLMIKKLK